MRDEIAGRLLGGWGLGGVRVGEGWGYGRGYS